jgi:hypothetical protein
LFGSALIFKNFEKLHPSKLKDKAVPIQACAGPQVSKKLRLPDF